MNAFEPGTVVDWVEVTMTRLIGLADDYAYRFSECAVSDTDDGCDLSPAELAAEEARGDLVDALREALTAVPTDAGKNAIQDIGGDNLRDTLAPMEEPELVAQKIVQRGAIHALETLLTHGCTEQVARDMLASCRANLLVIKAVGCEKGFPAFTYPDGLSPKESDHG